MSRGSCKFLARAHVQNPTNKPPKWKGGKPRTATVSAAGWRQALSRARELRDSSVYLDCPEGSITLVNCYDYKCVTSTGARETKAIAGARRRRR